jgi:tetratricopeptide (TPR) repeat protein
MVSGNDSTPPAEFDRIRPASLDLTARAPAAAPATAHGIVPGQYLLWGGVALLLAVAAVVIFVLPAMVKTPRIETAAPQAAPVTAATPAAPAPVAAPAGDAPWQRAQQAEMRKQTQEVLAQLLDAQKVLKEKNVTAWAGKDYQAALDRATAGDAQYNQQKFDLARTEYAAALQLMNDLVARIEPLFEESMTNANRALDEGDAKKAQAAFDTALAIDPLDRAALDGRKRAANLDQVLAAIRQGDELRAAGRDDAAKEAYRKALELDPLTRSARQRIDEIDAGVAERGFAQAMSSGLANLEQGRLAEARSSFAEALRLKPGSREAQDGIAQADVRLRGNRINALLEQAQGLERQEKWREAQTAYEQALAIDSGLAQAMSGRDATANRAKVHERLEAMLADPRSLYDPQAYTDAVAFHRTLHAIAEPGPTLSRQLAALGTVLDKAAAPIEVRFLSDNQTRVTLYKVGELGRFESRAVSLRPGRYVAVGVRDGFQDVRREFFVDPDQPLEPISVVAGAGVASGSARSGDN